MEPANPDSAHSKGELNASAEIPIDFFPPDAANATNDVAETDEYFQDSIKAKELYALAVQEAEKGDARQTLAHFLRAGKQAEIANEWYLAAIAFHAAGDIYQKAGPERNLEHASRMHRRAIAAYEECGHFDESRDLDYQVSATRMWHARELKLSWFSQIEMFLFWATAGFGYRPFRVLGSSIAVVFAFAFIYWVTSGVQTYEEDPVNDFATAAYFSGSTFLTINYGDLIPAPHVRWLTVAEGLAGLTMSSFFVVVLANRLRH